MFFSGPTYKGKHYKIEGLKSALLSHSHKTKEARSKINHMLNLIKKLLKIPSDYKLAIINGSCTAAMEAIIWNLLGNYPITTLNWDNFADEWAYDLKQLGFTHETKTFIASKADCANAFNQQHTKNNDLLFTWTSTSSGVKPNKTNFLETNGLKICDAAAVAFVEQLPWNKLDATGFSLQKGLGSEAGLGIVVFSPQAYERLSEKPATAVPRLFRLRKAQDNPEPNILAFEGHALNTISMLLVEDAILQLEYLDTIGIEQHYQQAEKNKQAVEKFLENSTKMENIIPSCLQSNSSFCIQPINENWKQAIDEVKRKYIEYIAEKAQLQSIIGHPRFQPSWRFWIGPFMETATIMEGLKNLEKTIAENPFN